MNAALPDHVRHFLQSHFTLTLATAAGGTPWAAAVYYASDDDLGLYFISDPDSRHVRDGLATGHVAVAIHGAHQPWSTIAGVQLEGRLERVADADRSRVERLYLARFTDIAWLLRHVDDGSAKVAAKFNASNFYRIVPLRLRLIDNTRGFGKPEEFELGPLTSGWAAVYGPGRGRPGS